MWLDQHRVCSPSRKSLSLSELSLAFSVRALCAPSPFSLLFPLRVRPFVRFDFLCTCALSAFAFFGPLHDNFGLVLRRLPKIAVRENQQKENTSNVYGQSVLPRAARYRLLDTASICVAMRRGLPGGDSDRLRRKQAYRPSNHCFFWTNYDSTGRGPSFGLPACLPTPSILFFLFFSFFLRAKLQSFKLFKITSNFLERI